eukprot:1160966-Pelagomonas_calceolata.AAC.4
MSKLQAEQLKGGEGGLPMRSTAATGVGASMAGLEGSRGGLPVRSTAATSMGASMAGLEGGGRGAMCVLVQRWAAREKHRCRRNGSQHACWLTSHQDFICFPFLAHSSMKARSVSLGGEASRSGLECHATHTGVSCHTLE